MKIQTVGQIDRWVDEQLYRLIDMLNDRNTDRRANGYTRQTFGWPDGQTDGQIDRQTDGYAVGQTVGQIERWKNRQLYSLIDILNIKIQVPAFKSILLIKNYLQDTQTL